MKRQHLNAWAAAGVIALAAGVSYADRGRGSVRAVGRTAPERVETPRAEPAHGGAPAAHVNVSVHVNAPAPARRDWDENDEDPRHFGGFAAGSPARAGRGQRFHDLPPQHVDLFFHNRHFFFDPFGACYALQSDGEYLVVQPPVGIVIAGLPPGAVPIQVGPTTYDYLDGVFYVNQGGSFAVVSPPPGIVVPTLPDGASQVIVNSSVTYQFNGFNYTPSIQDGVTVYTVTPA